jgi:hypothetical protein
VNPFKLQFPHEIFLRELTKEEYIEACKKGIGKVVQNARKIYNLIRD